MLPKSKSFEGSSSAQSSTTVDSKPIAKPKQLDYEDLKDYDAKKMTKVDENDYHDLFTYTYQTQEETERFSKMIQDLKRKQLEEYEKGTQSKDKRIPKILQQLPSFIGKDYSTQTKLLNKLRPHVKVLEEQNQRIQERLKGKFYLKEWNRDQVENNQKVAVQQIKHMKSFTKDHPHHGEKKLQKVKSALESFPDQHTNGEISRLGHSVSMPIISGERNKVANGGYGNGHHHHSLSLNGKGKEIVNDI